MNKIPQGSKKTPLIAGGMFGLLVLVVAAPLLFAEDKHAEGMDPPAADYGQLTATPVTSSPGKPLLPAPTGTAPRSNSSTPVAGPSAPTPTPAPKPISFGIGIEQTRAPETSVLFSASIKVYLQAKLVNRGNFDAHNVTVTAKARVGESYVKIDGKPELVIPLATVTGGATVAKDLVFTIGMSLSQANNARSNGIIFEITIASDEVTSVMPLMRCTETGCASA